MRRHEGQRSWIRPLMITEYQEKFLAPRCYTAQLLGSTFKHPYQQQLKTAKTSKEDRAARASSGDGKERTLEMPTFRSNYMAQKWVHNASKLPPVTSPNPMTPNKCCCAQFCPACTKESSKANLTVYQRDFQVWTPSKRQPFRLHDNLKVCRGMDVDLKAKEHQPIERATSYNTAFITHPLQARKKLDKPGFQDSNFSLWHPAPSCCGHCTDRCKSGSRKFPKPGKDKEFSTTMRADFTEHKCPRTKPFIPPKPNGRSTAPFQGTTTMRDDYRKWDLPRRPVITKNTKKDWKKLYDQISFSMNSPEPNHCQKCHSYRRNSDKGANDGPVEFDCLTAGSDGKVSKSASASRMATWMKCDVNKDQTQIVSCVVSARN